MGVHQLFFPLVGEANEHVLACALQSLSVVCHKVHEALNVYVIFEVHGQNVSHFRSFRRSYVSPIGNAALRRLSESKPLNRVHSTIESVVTVTHCERSVDTLWVEYAAKLLACGLLRFQQGLLGSSRKEALKQALFLFNLFGMVRYVPRADD